MLAIKRIIDVVIATTVLVGLSPLFILVAMAVCIDMGWPPLFRQTRVGLNGRLFAIYKFRTMTQATDTAGALLPDAQRLTAFGKFLRRTTLDELPEAINVLRGDMSLVGPRPLLPEYLPYYTAEQARRHAVRPGITGLAQVNGRNALSWEEKFALDVWYVDHASLWLDLKIILKTAAVVLGGKGVSAPGHPTMPRFDHQSAQRRDHAS